MFGYVTFNVNYYILSQIFLKYYQVSPSGAAICRCQEGYNHLPGQSTIEGCPTRRQAQTTQNRFERPSRPSRPRRPVQSLPNRISPNIIEVGDPCQPSPCGTNADCSVVGNRAVRFLIFYVRVKQKLVLLMITFVVLSSRQKTFPGFVFYLP